MAGLLPSEGKLRGSPANILRRCNARQICRAILFSKTSDAANCAAKFFLRERGDHARASLDRGATTKRIRCAKTANSCGFAQFRTACIENVALRLITCDRARGQRRISSSREARNVIAMCHARRSATKIFAHHAMEAIARRCVRASSRRVRSHHRSRMRYRPAGGARVDHRSGIASADRRHAKRRRPVRNRPFDPGIRDSRGNRSI